ncbi:MAG: M23 family metallopeptidase [Verrucomicrobiota bacterium]
MEREEEEFVRRGWLLVGLWLGLGLTVGAQRVSLQLPTKNDGLLRGDLKAFYMPTDLKSRPPESGSWGFVRNRREIGGEEVYTRFHEGLDIRPMARDERGLPVDTVGAIANGRVAYVNGDSRASNYGKYVVVEHDFGYGPMFSLYAHLASTAVKAGTSVRAGTVLGKMGSTGRGLNNARAHLHLELGIQYSERFDDWHLHYLRAGNRHGNWNGINLNGMNLGELYLQLQKDPKMSLARWIHALPQHYRVVVPRKAGSGPLAVAKRYWWAKFGNHNTPSESWEMAFTRSGFLVGIAPSNRKVNKPTVTYVRASRVDHRHKTIGRLTGTGSAASLTSSGERFIALVTDDFPRGLTP